MPSPYTSAQDVAADFARRGLPEQFCHVPFSTLILEPDGSVGSCRHKGSDFPVGNILEDTLEEIWNGPAIRRWRREFLSGTPRICRTETEHRACHLCPSYNALLPRASIAEVQTSQPIRLGINFNGHCNLECQMCHVWKKPNGLYDSIGFWTKLETLLPGLQEVELLSGEPFIQKDTYRLIDLVAEKNASIRFTINTNGHWKFTDTVRRALDQIQFRSLIVSPDSLDPATYAKIRRGGKLEVVLRTIQDLLAYDRDRVARGLGSLNLKLNFLIQRDNWRELGRFHRFGLENGIGVFRTFLYEPEEFSLLTLPEAEREEILDFTLSSLTPAALDHSMRIVLPLLDSLPKTARCDYLLRLRALREKASIRPKSVFAGV